MTLDYYALESQLSDDERMVRHGAKVRRGSSTTSSGCVPTWDFPKQVFRGLRRSASSARTCREVRLCRPQQLSLRLDQPGARARRLGLRSFVSVQSSLVDVPDLHVRVGGQRPRWLPKLASAERSAASG